MAAQEAKKAPTNTPPAGSHVVGFKMPAKFPPFFSACAHVLGSSPGMQASKDVDANSKMAAKRLYSLLCITYGTCMDAAIC